MAQVLLIAVGRLGEKHWREAAAEYVKRLGAFCGLETLEIPEARLPKKPSEAEIAQAVASEGKSILSKLPLRARLFSLCVEGKQVSSETLAGELSGTFLDSFTPVFVIGGSYGLSEKVKAASAVKLSVSAMTFPHQLARVMLLEQLYRAFTINAGMPYHK